MGILILLISRSTVWITPWVHLTEMGEEPTEDSGQMMMSSEKGMDTTSMIQESSCQCCALKSQALHECMSSDW